MFQELAKTYHKPFQKFQPDAPASSRDDWENLDTGLLSRLISDGADCQNQDWPVLTATDYLDYTRTGRRAYYEGKLFARRTLLNSMVLAECAEHEGNFMDSILNGIWSICEETSWCLPAHNSYIHDTPQLPLPDPKRPVIDLFSAETAAVLSTARYLLQSELDAISPAIDSQIDKALTERIFLPYLKEHFWWMGDGTTHVNNWTVWCTQNVLLSSSLSNLEEGTRQAIFVKACESLDYFLAEYGEDGCCDEGAQYYRHAGLCLFGCMEILNAITDGHFKSLYQEPKIRNIAAYILQAHAAGPYYINFADCSPIAGSCGAREFLFGKRTNCPRLMRLAAADFCESEDPLLKEEHNLFYRLLTIFTAKEMTGFDTDGTTTGDDIYYPSTGLFIVRDSRFCLAVKAGDNDDSHNHNDVGSFTIYQNGQPLFVDIGVETYQQKTFSPERYSIWTMQSQYHNLPSFTGCRKEDADACPYGYAKHFGGTNEIAAMQHNGPQYKAERVQCQITEQFGEISMDIGNAYPDSQVTSYYRTVRLIKEKGITITDTAKCGNLQPVLSLITYEEPDWDDKNSTLTVKLPNPAHHGHQITGTCHIDGAAHVKKERLPITDNRLKTAWKHDMWRTLVTFQKESCCLTIK